jgi:hypothetical protein
VTERAKGPQLRAEFVTDANGTPETVHGEGVDHFRIKLFVDDAPDGTHAVTYELDPTYFDPVREVRAGVQRFEQEITSYGDYELSARVRHRGRTEYLGTSLTKALEGTYGSGAEIQSPAVRDAIDRLKEL